MGSFSYTGGKEFNIFSVLSNKKPLQQIYAAGE
jgi:hypothetical protein